VNVSEQAEAIVECLPDPAILLGRDYRILYANAAYRETYGDAVGAGRHCYQVSHRYTVPCDLAGESCPLRQSLETGENARVLHVHHTPRGQEYVNVEMWPVKRPRDGEVLFFVELMRPSRVASARASSEGIVGGAPTLRRALELVERVAPSEATAMLLGESGTGKELLAQTVHNRSRRAGGPFVPVECTGMPETLFESELFGYVRGAFTGATRDKPGLVEAAAGGTLFLDEVGDIPLSEQVKLLRLLETRRFRRVGGTDWQDADFRLICATHRDLAALVRRGEFREDLYYRLNVFEIEIPPLRDRRDDIPALVESMLGRLSPSRPVRFSPEAMACLRRYRFPGNVRELRNVVERAVLLADDAEVRPEHFPAAVREAGRTGAEEEDESGTEVIPLVEVERRYLRRVLASHDVDRRTLAKALGVSERSLYRKIAGLQRG
jgi:two-component system, NtrC family, response regulator HydG